MVKLIVGIHGYGSNGADLEFLKNDIESVFDEEKVIGFFPNAPFVLKANSYQWFPIDIFDEEYIMNGIKNVYPIFVKHLDNFLKNNNIDYKDVILAGFSQGAALALHTAYHLSEKVFCVISFSGGLSNYRNTLQKEIIHRVPTLLIHGHTDAVLPPFLSMKAYRELKKLRVPVEIKLIKNMKHVINQEAVNLATNFIASCKGTTK